MARREQAENDAATRIQSRVRGERDRKLLEGDLARRASVHHDANLDVSGAPYLYVQTRHVLELEALLPAALGPNAAGESYFEPTDCYTIRHSSEPPEAGFSEPPLVGLIARQRARNPPPCTLRVRPDAREGYMLSRLRRYARGTRVEMRAVRAALSVGADGGEDDSVVQQVYARRQLVRLVLPSAEHFAAVFKAAERRNGQLLEAMGLSDGDEKSPKVISELLVPLTPFALDIVLATVTLQRVWRSIAARGRLRPSLAQRLLRARAVVRLQRWWRWHLCTERLRMLCLVRERVLAVDSNKLYIPTAIFEDLEGRRPLHEKALWPEHASLRFTFAHSATADVQYFVAPDAARPEMPAWCAPRMPVAQARALQQPQEALSLLSMGVRAALVPRGTLRRFVKRDWTCVCFHSMVEATRRVALLTAIGYEPLAMRTVHGRLQGRFFYNLTLSSWSELERGEAAACIQACVLARRARKALAHTLSVARGRREKVIAQRQAERETNSLLGQTGVLDVSALQPPQPLRAAHRRAGGAGAGGAAEHAANLSRTSSSAC